LSSELIPILLSVGLLATVGAALASSKVSNSLIALFYTSMVLGVTFTIYGDALLGLLTMITFAGAISVLLLSVVLITGESKLELGARKAALAAIPLVALIGALAASAVFSGQGGGQLTADVSLNVLAFIWTLRPWDLLILVTVFGGAMLSIISLLGGDE
jgi:NADH:ubiquinone oxidoreductase subunit 6 (subunit J)